jgi:SAM-dependent methyltransferase
VDIRNAHGLLGRIGAGLAAFNRRHPWSHNDHFHGWVLRNLPPGRSRALDVGCGRGELLAALAPRFVHVDGVDADAEMARIAAARFAGDPRVSVRALPFEQVSGRYDLITMVAVLHHLDLAPALRHAAGLLTDHGRLLVVGLARPATWRDLAYDLASAGLNPLVGMLKQPRAVRHPDPPPFPVADPVLSFDEVRATASSVLPGVRLRRRLFFRFTARWSTISQSAAGEPC